MTTVDMIMDARCALEDIIECTPVVSSTRMSPNLLFKCENLQKTGSFKIRGAYNRVSRLSEEEAEKGIIACSSGNHAQGVALSAAKRGIKSVICMPESAPEQKVSATKNYGGEVVLVPGAYDDAAAKALKLSEENGYTLIHPFNDPFVIAGQGTIGMEILEQVHDVEQIIVPVGGGGLISGIALAVKTLKPACRVIGVQATGVPSMYGSVAAGRILTVKDRPTLADGIHVLTPGDITFEMVNTYVDDMVTVSEGEIAGAMVRMLEAPKIVAEGAGATSAAAFLFGKVDTTLKTVCVISGGNVDVPKLYDIIEKGGRMLEGCAHL